MKERPILFSTEMVKALLDGRKTQTRRIVKLQPGDGEYYENLSDGEWAYISHGGMSGPYKCPYGKPGDVLWVRENWQIVHWNFDDGLYTVRYQAGGEQVCELPEEKEDWLVKTFEAAVAKDYLIPGKTDTEPFTFTGKIYPFKPSIYMPKAACRLKLLIKSIRVERLQRISWDDAIAEGIASRDFGPLASIITGKTEPADWKYKHYLKDKWGPDPIHSYQTLWQKINGEESWKLNPYVWVIEFEKP